MQQSLLLSEQVWLELFNSEFAVALQLPEVGSFGYAFKAFCANAFHIK